ncbi:MAG: cytidylate kinase-like family protein [Elusimicrobia bacterium]|nr:cytidylate kinase-like family protein [Elusimicrobiota bacterium]
MTQPMSVEKLIEEQISRWKAASCAQPGEAPKPAGCWPVIALSRLPGCNTSDIAAETAKRLGFEVFDGKLMTLVAEDAGLSENVVKTLDEKAVSVMDDWIKSITKERHLSSEGMFLRLLRIVTAIASHGRAVLVGRACSMILPPDECLRVLLIAPLETRVSNVVRKTGCSYDEARKSVIQKESDRRAFVRKHFNADMTDPLHYDVVINTDKLDVASAAGIIAAAWAEKKELLLKKEPAAAGR